MSPISPLIIELQDLEALRVAFQDMVNIKYSNVASLAFLVYDHFLTLPSEIQRFWNVPWTFVKVLYLLIRYLGIVMSFSLIIVANSVVTTQFCRTFLALQVTLIVIMIFLAGLILSLKVYAVYNRNRLILATSLFFCFSTAFVGEAISFVYLPTADTLSRFGLSGCFATEFPRNFAFNSVPSLVNEVLQLILMGVKVWPIYRRYTGSRLLRIITRDSIVSFLGVITVLVINMVFWRAARTSLSLGGLGWLIAVRASLCGRLLLNIRESDAGYRSNQESLPVFAMEGLNTRNPAFRRERYTQSHYSGCHSVATEAE